MSVDLGNGNIAQLKKLMIGPMVSSIADSAFGIENVVQDDAFEEVSFYCYLTSAQDTEYRKPALQKTGKCAFYGHSNLTSIALPDTVSFVNSKTFHSCANLSSISLPSHLSATGSYLFKNCVSLSSIDFPASVEEIGKNSFTNCPSLEYAYFEGKTFSQVSAMKSSFWNID